MKYLFAAIAVFMVSQVAQAQDSVIGMLKDIKATQASQGDRIAALEAQVAAQAKDIADLKAQTVATCCAVPTSKTATLNQGCSPNCLGVYQGAKQTALPVTYGVQYGYTGAYASSSGGCGSSSGGGLFSKLKARRQARLCQ